MYEFKYLNYCANYSVSGDISHKEGIVKNLKEYKCSGDVCFADVFYGRVRKNNKKLREANYDETPITAVYRIRFLKYRDDRYDNIDSNVLVDRDCIARFIEYATRVVPFTFTVKEFSRYYCVTIKIDKLKIIFHKFILTWVRYLYEYPYNTIPCFIDNIVNEYPQKSPVLLYHIMMACFANFGTGHCMIDTMSPYIKQLTDEGIYNALDNTQRLNSVFTRRKGMQQKQLLRSPKNMEQLKENTERYMIFFRNILNDKQDD